MSTISNVSRNYPITFQAKWHEHNKHLAETTLEKVNQFFFHWINKLIMRLVLPATQISQERVAAVTAMFNERWSGEFIGSQLLNETFTPSPIEVTTPDGAILRGTHFKNAIASENAPTVIFFQSNAMISKLGAYDWVLKQAALQEFPYNFVYFDYRGCGESKGTPCLDKNLFLDGESIYQFVRDKLHVPANDIHFYGWSLGGGVGPNVKEMHYLDESRSVIERSFTSIHSVVKNFLTDYVERFPWIHSTIKVHLSSILTSIACFWISLLNWNIESTKAIKTLKGKTLIVHHPEDEFMKEEASLYNSLFQSRTAPLPQIEQLNLNRSSFRPSFVHGARLDRFATPYFNPENEISKFLFSSNSTFSERLLSRFAIASPEFKNKVFRTISQLQSFGSYWGSGEDAFYNRNGLSMSDEERVRVIELTKHFSQRDVP